MSDEVRPRRIRDNGLDLGAKRYTQGVIPEKVSDLENDLNYTTVDEVTEMISSGFGLTGEFFINFLKGLTASELKQIEDILDKYEESENDQDHTIESVNSDDINW